MKKLTIILSIFIFSCGKLPIEKVCPDCLETNCIYQEINDNVKGEGTDQEIYNSVLEVCRKRKITNQATIELLLKEYYL